MPRQTFLRDAYTFGITDIVVSPSTPQTTTDPTGERITGFYKRAADPHRTHGPTHLLPCTHDDPDFGIVSTYGTPSLVHFHRPWDLTWHRPAPWPVDIVDHARSLHQAEVAYARKGNTEQAISLHNLDARFPALTHHDRVRVLAWVRQCQAAAAAWVATPDNTPSLRPRTKRASRTSHPPKLSPA